MIDIIDNQHIKNIVSLFKIDEEIIESYVFGEGHINVTVLVITKNNKYILQRINDYIFPNIDGLMNNIDLVTTFIRNKLQNIDKDYKRKTLTIIKSKEDKLYAKYLNGYYRIYEYIENSIAFQTVENEKDFYNSAKAFSHFYRLLDGFDASKLVEVIPNFHNTKKRYNDFLISLKNDKFKRAKECVREIEFIKSREQYYSKLVDMINDGSLPLKVTHNDTKLNNILFDKTTKEALAIIDLDTIMPGTICYDFGEAIRTGCNPSLEDEKDLNKVQFQFRLYQIYLKGFLEGLGDSITRKEKDNLALGAILMTIENGIRFLTDYLNGDIYFHTNRSGQNLDRSRTQLKLVADMEKVFDKMNALVHK